MIPTLASGGADSTINPFIRYWEPARFDRGLLDVAHQHHEQHRRRRRSINYEHGSAAYGPANVVRLNFRAHDRVFQMSQLPPARYPILSRGSSIAPLLQHGSSVQVPVDRRRVATGSQANHRPTARNKLCH
uniref:Uncharacterized protein n=1 Tax=Anopheles melas TaxID=34690 RepID=A0A182UH52_9DIPT